MALHICILSPIRDSVSWQIALIARRPLHVYVLWQVVSVVRCRPHVGWHSSIRGLPLNCYFTLLLIVIVQIEWNRVVWCSGIPSELRRICGYPDSCFPDCRHSLKRSVWIIVPSKRCNSRAWILLGA
jgi:hypothetical protein